MTLTIVKDATCTFCGCVCDDMELHTDGVRILKAKNACSLGESWFRHHTAERLYPDALIDGKPATVDAAVAAAENNNANATYHGVTIESGFLIEVRSSRMADPHRRVLIRS